MRSGLLLHALSIVFLGSVSTGPAVFLGMPFFAAGASVMPILLGLLTRQVAVSEVGALQGAADTVRTIASVVGSPLISRLLAYSIRRGNAVVPGQWPLGAPGLSLYVASIFSFLGFALFSLYS